MTFTAGELLAALEPLSHADRLRHTALTAHRLARRGELRPLLDALDALGPYERRLAALAALVGGEAGHLAARLADPDPVVRRYAVRATRGLPVPDAAVEAAYDDAPAVVRADLARLLRDGRRSGLAERLVPRVRTEYGDRDAARLLPGCSPEFTARLLPELAGALAPEDWNTLAVRHPAAVLDQAERELGDLPEQLRDRWWKQHATGVAAALPAAPGRVLDLLERHGPGSLPGPVHDRLVDLVAVDAERVVRWLSHPARTHERWERLPGRAVLVRLAAAGSPSLPGLAARWFHRGAFPELLRSLPPPRRPAFLDAVLTARGPRAGLRAHEGLLALLPADERYARARAALAELRAGGGTAWDVWGMMSLLPPAEARPGLLAALGTGDADARGSLWIRLVLNADRTRVPGEVAQVLVAAAGRLANERDPVRQEALDAFADLRPSLLLAALHEVVPTAGAGERTAAALLERLCRDALRARDCSPATRRTVRRLALNLLAASAEAAELPEAAAPTAPAGAAAPTAPAGAAAPTAPAGAAAPTAPAGADPADGAGAARTALRLVEALTAHTGAVDLGDLGRDLPVRGIRALLGVLGPWLDRAAGQGDFTPLLALTASCGNRAHRLPELHDRLERALHTCPDGAFGALAAAWLAAPATRRARVGVLLEREPSAVFVPEVLAVLAAERTDLLDPVLTGNPPPDGRFPAAGPARPLPPFRHADRWLPRQQRAAVRLAAAVVADPGRGLDERAALLRAVAPVPRYGRELLRRYAPTGAAGTRLEEGDGSAAGTVLGMAALDAAARTDDPASALEDLLALAGDDRASAAWSAAGRAAAHARPTRVAALLRSVLTCESGVKVTVRKAAARLAVHHLPPGAATALLTRVGRTPGVHPDVLAAVLGLAPALLPAEEVWELLESAAADGPEAARSVLLDPGPADLAPAHRARYGELVARLPFVSQEPTAGRAVSLLSDWARYAPAAGAALAEVYTDLSTSRGATRAGYGLRNLAGSGLSHPTGGVQPGSLVHGVVERLLELVAAGEPEGAGPGRDLPARRRLEGLVGPGLGDPRTCAALARRLEVEPALASTRTTLLVGAVDLTADGPELLGALHELARAVRGRPVLAARAAEVLETMHRYGDPLPDPAEALDAAGRLADGGALAEGLLAIALARAVGVRQQWPDACRAVVLALRRHPDREVRETAYATVLGGN
ncbi:hypothetical protein ACIRBY_33685 [Streptomyces sp. NPDC096136]|uniref:hypothetical protein n=1 Tax=Streptomyces sp. NPDC096136 TaxID=3366076 RepID=UPI0037F30FD3